MKKLLLTVLLLISILIMAHADYQIISTATYPSLSQVQ